MNNALVFSIQPRWSELIVKGKKKYELRRRGPSQGAIGSIAYIYSTAPVSAIIGTFIVASLVTAEPAWLWVEIGHSTGCSRAEFFQYFDGRSLGTAIGISDVRVIERPIPLNVCRERIGSFPPRSWAWLDDGDLIL